MFGRLDTMVSCPNFKELKRHENMVCHIEREPTMSTKKGFDDRKDHLDNSLMKLR
jgi:hypothetical protein